MKFKVNHNGKTIHFLRNLNTEKMFRDELAAEMNAQLATLMQIFMELEQGPTQETIEAVTSLEFSETRHQILQFCYAEKSGASLIQNEDTRARFEQIEGLDEKAALAELFRCL